MVSIRSAKKTDTTGILEIYAPFILHTTTCFEIKVPSKEAFWLRIEKVQKETPWLVCEIDGIIAGYAYASAHRSRHAYQWSREVSVYIHSDFRQMGIARALYTALFELLRMQGYPNIFAGITQPNEASVAFHKSMGFEIVGTYKRVGYKKGAWRDVSWWSLPLDNLDTAPTAIIDLTSILHLAKAKEKIKACEESIKI